ncbi:MAG TPA: DUF2461 family protein, partial [Candidatus Paceibacterota bacterium]|nr:DUF2461 family protein [Candidatus Paceibacterota bacterium]
ESWRKASRNKKFQETFEREGDRLSRPPKGYDASHPFIEDLKMKDFVAMKKLPESFAGEADLPSRLTHLWGIGTPFMRFLCNAVGAPFA